MSLGLILYIEDSESQRKSLKMALEHRGFKVEVAGDVEAARRLFEKLRGQIDVVVLDMRLEDPKCPQMTGADVAIEYYNPQTLYPPEFLIHSAYSEVDYYKLALQLGVATYLEKSEYKQVDLIRHIRALAIRRFLSIKRPEATDRIQRIVETSRNRSEAIAKFCRNELKPQFSGRLGTPFVLLLTEAGRTYCYTGEAGLPEHLDLYKTIQAMVFSEIRPANPFIVDADKMPKPLGPEDEEVLKRLNGAAFIPLTIDGNIRLSVGLLAADPGVFPLPEPPAEMASVLARHLESAVIETFLTVLTKWTEHHTKTETRRKELIGISAGVCLSVGRRQHLSLQELKNSFPSLAENNDFKRLQKMAEDLQVKGSMLESLAKADRRKEQYWLRVEGVSLNHFLKSVWTDLNNGVSRDVLSIHGDCEIRATPEDLSVIVSSILQWFAQRFIDTPHGIEPIISVNCGYYDEGAELIFEDRSRRLDKVLLEHLFYPFAETTMTFVDNDIFTGDSGLYSSLFLAKILVETRYNGVLEDITDSLTSTADESGENRGHRFRMRFPKPGAVVHK
jgi:CheY-like chemotaxis protein